MPSFCSEAILHWKCNLRTTKERGLHLYQWGRENVSPGAAEACPLKFLPPLPAMHLLLPCITLLWIFPCELCYRLCESDSEGNQTESIASPPCTWPWLFVPQTGHNRVFLEQKYTALNALPHGLCAWRTARWHSRCSLMASLPFLPPVRKGFWPMKLKGYTQ